MTPLRFEAARQCVIDRVSEHRRLPRIEHVSLECAAGRVLAEPIFADRDYPPFARSIRDGFAVQSATFQGEAQVIGEVRAGEQLSNLVLPGQAVEIMTGAPLPEGADAVVMVEHVERNSATIRTTRNVTAGDFVNAPGSERRAGEQVLEAGTRIDFAGTAVVATIGKTSVNVYAKPRVSIVATGDELVAVDAVPAVYQIRNSNSYSLAAQVIRAGGIPAISPIARDTYQSTRDCIEAGLQSDLLLLSGGVSAGKYDIVEQVLADLGAEFYFDRALIQPGQPVVFGRVAGTFFFGLPGNPASTMVTFEVFASAAIHLISGMREASFPIALAKLGDEFRHKPGLTRFLPAKIEPKSTVTPVRYNGSGDVFALGQANALLIARDDRESWAPGELIEVLPR